MDHDAAIRLIRDFDAAASNLTLLTTVPAEVSHKYDLMRGRYDAVRRELFLAITGTYPTPSQEQQMDL